MSTPISQNPNNWGTVKHNPDVAASNKILSVHRQPEKMYERITGKIENLQREQSKCIGDLRKIVEEKAYWTKSEKDKYKELADKVDRLGTQIQQAQKDLSVLKGAQAGAKPLLSASASPSFEGKTEASGKKPLRLLPITAVKVFQKARKEQPQKTANGQQEPPVSTMSEVFILSKKLGLGGAATVKTGKIEGIGPVACKEYNETMGQEEIAREIVVQASIPVHENIVQFYGVTKKDGDISRSIIELCTRGSVGSCKKDLDNQQKEKIIKGIVNGMVHLAGYGIVHRDLKCDNILLAEDFTAKIGDFGQATHEGTVEKDLVGTPKWMSPEAILGVLSCSEKSDVWMFASSVCELLLGEQPYKSLNDLSASFLIGSGKLSPIDMLRQREGCKITANESLGLTNEFLDLIAWCSKFEPEERPAFAQIAEELQKIEIFKLPDVVRPTPESS